MHPPYFAFVLNCFIDICYIKIVYAEVTHPLQAKQSVNETVAFPSLVAFKIFGSTNAGWLDGTIKGLIHSCEGVI
jgi:hypothetical protein